MLRCCGQILQSLETKSKGIEVDTPGPLVSYHLYLNFIGMIRQRLTTCLKLL